VTRRLVPAIFVVLAAIAALGCQRRAPTDAERALLVTVRDLEPYVLARSEARAEPAIRESLLAE
jgi:hypothetical protein